MNIKYQCPYCGTEQTHSKKKFTSWRMVRSHAGPCKLNLTHNFTFCDYYGALDLNYLNTFESVTHLKWEYPNLTFNNKVIADLRSKSKVPFNVRPIKWCKNTCRIAFDRFVNKNDRSPERRDFDNSKDEYPPNAIIRSLYGSWVKYLEECGCIENSRIQWSKETIMNKIQEFYSLYNRIPKCKEFINPLYPSYGTVINRFGSWNQAIIESGYIPNTPSDIYGIPTVAKDGVLYRSKAEAYFVDNFLYKKYTYQYELPYGNGWLFDFYIKELDLYIELDGNIKKQDYIDKMMNKIEFCKSNNIKLRVIKIHEIRKSKFKLSECS